MYPMKNENSYSRPWKFWERTHKSYIKFRELRKIFREKNKKINGLELAKTLDNYAQTGSEYTKILQQIIVQNKLMDFELVRLANSVQRRELNL